MDGLQRDIASTSGVSRPVPGDGGAADGGAADGGAVDGGAMDGGAVGVEMPLEEGLPCSLPPTELGPSSPPASGALKTFP